LQKKYVKTGARLPNELNKKVEDRAEKVGISKNDIILLALTDYLKGD